MRQRLISAALALAALLAAQPASAADRKPGAGEKPGEPGTNVEMPILVAPVVVDRKLTSYAYVSGTIVASSAAAAIAIRAKVPFIQDAFVRDVNDDPMGEGPARDKIDQEALKRRLLADAQRVVGPGKVVAYRFTQVQVSQVRPASP